MYAELESREYTLDGVSGPLDLNCCYYCGSPASTIDHIPPRAVRKLMLSDPSAFGQYEFKEVDCCKECNSALGKKFWTLKERKQYIGKWLRKRYRKILAIPDWSEMELQSLSPSLARVVRASLRERDIILCRLQWASPKLARISKPKQKAA